MSIHRESVFLLSRKSIATAILVIACVVIAIGLFLAGAMWRARVTVPPHARVGGAA